MSEFKDSQYAKTAICPSSLSVGRAIIAGFAMIAHAISDLAAAVQELADNQ